MTGSPRPRSRRWPKRRIQALAWVAGAATLVSGGVALASGPPPLSKEGRGQRARPLIERHVIRRVIIVDPPKAPAIPPVVIAAAPPPAPPSTTTSGSHP